MGPQTVAQFYRAHAEDGRAVLCWRNTATGCREPLLWIVRVALGRYYIADDVIVVNTRASAGYLVSESGDALVLTVKRNWKAFHERVRADLHRDRPDVRTRAVA